MSAANIFLQHHRALIFTDASAYDTEGRLVALVDKCMVTDSGRLAVTGRGNAFFPAVLAENLADFTIDDIEADGGDLIETSFEEWEHVMDAAGKAFNDVFIVGWSEREQKAKIAQWSNVAPSGVPRFSMVDSVMAPGLDAEGYAFVQRAVGTVNRDTADYRKLGVTVMEAQRRTGGSAEFAAEGQFLVGGHVLMTEVSATGIGKTIVHTWKEDEIGERIRPPALLDPTQHANVSPIGLNRQQRRALDHSKRRVA